MAEVVFYFIAICTCVFASLTVFSRDVFHSAMWLALSLLSISGIYFYLGAEFLGVIQVLVYVGGIMTLFIFAIKLTAHIGDTKILQANRQKFFSAIAALTLFYLLLQIIEAAPWAQTSQNYEPISLKHLGLSLMGNYALPFEFISIILLSAMIGAIIIGKVKK